MQVTTMIIIIMSTATTSHITIIITTKRFPKRRTLQQVSTLPLISCTCSSYRNISSYHFRYVRLVAAFNWLDIVDFRRSVLHLVFCSFGQHGKYATETEDTSRVRIWWIVG